MNTTPLGLTLTKIEDFLVERIYREVIENVRIEEPVYTIMLAYSIDFAFPPAIGIGMESEKELFDNAEAYHYYNAPDMLHFSESREGEEGYIAIDLYDSEIEDAYSEIENEYQNQIDFDAFNSLVYNTYLNIIKRLARLDYSKAFVSTPDFLVMAGEISECNEEQFLADLRAK